MLNSRRRLGEIREPQEALDRIPTLSSLAEVRRAAPPNSEVHFYEQLSAMSCQL
jgi:hypothetical protein